MAASAITMAVTQIIFLILMHRLTTPSTSIPQIWWLTSIILRQIILIIIAVRLTSRKRFSNIRWKYFFTTTTIIMYCSFMMWFIRKNWLIKIILNIFTKLIVKFLNIKENHVIERSSFRENFKKSWKYVWKNSSLKNFWHKI